MSDYDYEEEYQYEQQPQPQEQDIGTRVELDYFEIEDLIRGGKMEKAILELEQLYIVCQQNNLKNYKIKILNQLLTIYCKNGQIDQIASTLSRISQLHKQEKYTQNSLKAIITIVRSSDYVQVKKELLAFIDNFDQEIRLKSYLYLLQRAIDEKDKEESQAMFAKAQSLFEDSDNISAAAQLEFYSLDIKYSKMIGIDITDKVHQIQLKIPKLQAEAYMSQGHISVLKLAFAEIMYESGNYEHSAANIFDAFMQKAKYGSSAQLKEILKTNALICLLIEDPALRKKNRVNSLYHECSIPFKNQTDIQHLISLIEAYQKQDLDEFSSLYQRVNFKPQNPKYLSIYQKLLFNMKKQKLLHILKSYQTIRFSFIGRRLHLNEQEAERIVFELIIDHKIRGRINDIDQKNKFLQIMPPRNQFLETQAENLRELGKRYLS